MLRPGEPHPSPISGDDSAARPLNMGIHVAGATADEGVATASLHTATASSASFRASTGEAKGKAEGKGKDKGKGKRRASDAPVCQTCLASMEWCTCRRGQETLSSRLMPRPQPGTPIGSEHTGGGEFATSANRQAAAAEDDAETAEDSAPPSQMRRLNVEGDAVPGSQDSELAARAQQLHLSEPESVEPTRVNRRRPRQQTTPSALLRCVLCGPGPGAFQPSDSRGLLLHLCRSHMGQPLTAEAVTQLRNLNKVACQICSRIRGRTTPVCSSLSCGGATPTRAIRLGDVIPDTRRANPAGTSEAPQRDERPGSVRGCPRVWNGVGTTIRRRYTACSRRSPWHCSQYAGAHTCSSGV